MLHINMTVVAAAQTPPPDIASSASSDSITYCVKACCGRSIGFATFPQKSEIRTTKSPAMLKTLVIVPR